MMQSNSVETLLRSHAEGLDEAMVPVTVEEVRRGAGTRVQPLPPWRVRRLRGGRAWAAAAAFVVVVVLVGLVPVMVAVFSGEAPPVIDTPTTLPESPTPTTTPPPSTVPPTETSTTIAIKPISWTRHELGDRGPALIAAGSDKLVGFSERGEAGEPIVLETSGGDVVIEGNAVTVWHSPDGRSWNEVPHDDRVFSGIIISAVAHGEPGFVAAGYNAPTKWEIAGRIPPPGVPSPGAWEEAAPVLFSSDGTTWTRLSVDQGVADGAEVFAIAYGAGRYVAAGKGPDTVDSNGDVLEAGTLTVWVSDDGTSWEQASLDPLVGFGGYMADIAYGAAGFVAVGPVVIDEQSRRGPFWHSPDGLSWTRLEYDETVFPELSAGSFISLRAVAHGAAGYVAIGGTGNEDLWWTTELDAWTSVDGLRWQRVEVDGLGVVEDVAHGDRGYVAAGYVREGGSSNSRGAVWVSSDGHQWTPAPGDQAFDGGGDTSIDSVAFFGGHHVAVGSESIDLDPAEGAERWVHLMIAWISD